MVSVLAWGAVDRWFDHGQLIPKTMELVFAAFPLSTQY